MSAQKIANIYKVRHPEGYELLLPVDSNDYENMIFDGKPRLATWQPIKMRRYRFTEDGRVLRPCDFPGGFGDSHLPMTNLARQRIGSYLERYGEFLPLKCNEGDFCTFQVTSFVDALDERASDVLRSPNEPNVVIMINKHIFRPDKLTDDWMFKLPQSRGRGAFYVTDPFVNMIRASGLTGLDFRRVWPHS
jgi:hypothetical protein